MYLRATVLSCKSSRAWMYFERYVLRVVLFLAVVERDFVVVLSRKIFVGRCVTVELQEFWNFTSFPCTSSFPFRWLEISQIKFLIHDTSFTQVDSSMYCSSPLDVVIIFSWFLIFDTLDPLITMMYIVVDFCVSMTAAQWASTVRHGTFLWRFDMGIL